MSGIKAEVIADSFVPVTGCRLTTFLVRFHRYVLSEWNTHRVFSRNTSSSRAIPTKKMLLDVIRDPAVPVRFGRLKKGMQDGGELRPVEKYLARKLWLLARWPAVITVFLLLKLGLHKQVANRLLEPWMWVTVVVSSSYWRNFYRLRYHPGAQPEIRELAEKMLRAHSLSAPRHLKPGEWHKPFEGRYRPGFSDERTPEDDQLKICTARLARTSYRNFFGKNDADDDIRLHNDLSKSGHFSPFEHCAQAMPTAGRSGNFLGFHQYRKAFLNENNFDHGMNFDAAKLLKELEASNV